MNTVTFDDSAELPESLSLVVPKKQGFSSLMTKLGLVRSHNDAVTLLLVISMLLLVMSVYIATASVPDPIHLGPDQLRSGEVVPAYVR